MTRQALCLLGVLALNLLALATASTRGAQLASALGALTAFLLVILPLGSRRLGAYVKTGLPDFSRSASPTLWLILLPFAVPSLSAWVHPQLAFWRLDQRVQLGLAWLIFVLALSGMNQAAPGDARAPRGARGPVPLPTVLFVAWSSLLWLTIVWDLGVGALVTGLDRSVGGPCRVDPLLATFRVWDSQPVSEHLFLFWREPDGFETRTVYASRGYALSLLMYAYMKLGHWLVGSLQVATNLAPFLAAAGMLTAFCVLVARSGVLAGPPSPRRYLTLFLAVGSLLTTWRLWNDLYRYNSDNAYPLLASLVVVAWSCLSPSTRRGALLGIACLFSALFPVYAPILILAIAALHARRAESVRGALVANRPLLELAGAATAAAAISYSATHALIAWKGYRASGSSFLFRSGLDGDATYFTGMLQAFARPCSVDCCGGRPLPDLLLPALLPLLACWVIGLHGHRAARLRLGRALLFLASPYLFSLVFFPQSVSVHPYLYDHLLLVPAVVVGGWATLLEPVQRRLRGAGLLAYLLLMAGVIMANLIGVAQGIARLPR